MKTYDELKDYCRKITEKEMHKYFKELPDDESVVADIRKMTYAIANVIVATEQTGIVFFELTENEEQPESLAFSESLGYYPELWDESRAIRDLVKLVLADADAVIKKCDDQYKYLESIYNHDILYTDLDSYSDYFQVALEMF